MRRKATGKLAPKVLSDKPTPHLKARLKLRAKRSIFSRFCTTTLAIVAVIWVFLEEWVWDSTLAAMQWIGKLPPIAWLEDRVKKLPPYAALVMFAVPAAVLLPFKLIAFWLIAHGHGIVGVQLFIVAKIVGTALLARIFALTKPALLSISWFARVYHTCTALKSRLLAYVKNLNVYMRAVAFKNAIRARVKSFWHQN